MRIRISSRLQAPRIKVRRATSSDTIDPRAVALALDAEEVRDVTQQAVLAGASYLRDKKIDVMPRPREDRRIVARTLECLNAGLDEAASEVSEQDLRVTIDFLQELILDLEALGARWKLAAERARLQLTLLQVIQDERDERAERDERK